DCLRGVNFHRTKASRLRDIAAILLRDFGGAVPSTFDKLVSLPGVGPKVANLVLSVTFGQVCGIGMVVDTHVHRVSRRLGWTTGCKLPEQTRKQLEEFIPEEARELVTLRLIGFGQEVCLPVHPRCRSCPLAAAKLCPSAAMASESAALEDPEGLDWKLQSPSKGSKRTVIQIDLSDDD
ncbi:unnamed protein product, partial [Polarella glacialis]